ncbi:MAG: sigma-70 family RNA polymerase sigma factor [Paludibacteraceae bacterium]|nr:sigma-70 family RNA polymerase sigma factor [Paludibacteraceae bacterium]
MTIDNNFIKSHARIVRTIAYQYDFPPMTHHDLMQEGYMGLIEAAKHYNPSTNLAFDSYASWWIRKFITRAMKQQVSSFSLTTVRCKEDEHNQ